MKKRMLNGLDFLATRLVVAVVIAFAIAIAAFLGWLVLIAVEPLTGWLATYFGVHPDRIGSYVMAFLLLTIAAVLYLAYRTKKA